MPGELLVRLSARDCLVRRIGKAEFSAFMDACHRLGNTPCRYRYGLFTLKEGLAGLPEGTLVAASGFSSCRNLPLGDGRVSRSAEWVRYASLPSVRVRGGMGKTLAAFLREVHPDDVMSYAEACPEVPAAGGPGAAYRALGFRLEGRKAFPGGGESLKFRLVSNQTASKSCSKNNLHHFANLVGFL